MPIMTSVGQSRAAKRQANQEGPTTLGGGSPDRSDWYSLAIVLMAIGSATIVLHYALEELRDANWSANDSSKRSNLLGLSLNGFIRDPLMFVATNYLMDLSDKQFLATNSSSSKPPFQQPADLPPVSMGFSDKLKSLVGGKHSRPNEIANYPLDQQPHSDRITHIDADLRSCLGPARAQLGCGACYAFSWNSLLEWHYCKQTGNLLDISEQHIIDCSNFGGFDACQAGKIEDAKSFAESFGFKLEQDCPYTAKYEQKKIAFCLNQEGLRFRTFQWRRLIVDRTEWERVLEEQPILVQARLPSDIMSYKRGIHPGNNCNERLLHGMLLVGHGREDGKPYWLIRNSMGERWGERGHFRLARDDSTMSQCLVTGWVGRFKFDSIEADQYEEFYSQIEFQPTEHILKGGRSSG